MTLYELIIVMACSPVVMVLLYGTVVFHNEAAGEAVNDKLKSARTKLKALKVKRAAVPADTSATPVMG